MKGYIFLASQHDNTLMVQNEKKNDAWCMRFEKIVVDLHLVFLQLV